METRDPGVDAYIQKSADFARPILTQIREIVHGACPEAEETLKWGFPHFTYKGILCSMASFKEHCALNFWKGDQVLGPGTGSTGAMGQFGRLTSVRDLPPKRVLTDLVKRAMALNDEGTPGPISQRARSKGEPEAPEDLRAALMKNKKARATFDGFPPRAAAGIHQMDHRSQAPRDSCQAPGDYRGMAVGGEKRNWKYEKS